MKQKLNKKKQLHKHTQKWIIKRIYFRTKETRANEAYKVEKRIGTRNKKTVWKVTRVRSVEQYKTDASSEIKQKCGEETKSHVRHCDNKHTRYTQCREARETVINHQIGKLDSVGKIQKKNGKANVQR